MTISLNIWVVLAYQLFPQLQNLLRGRKALASSSISFQNVLLLREVSHALDDLSFMDSIRNLAQIPTCVILEL